MIHDDLEKQAADTLDAFHAAASRADSAAYFPLFWKEAVFIGTDKTERWPIRDFIPYAQERFDSGTAWRYRALERHVSISPCGGAAWFDERLENEKGEARGSGVLLKEPDGWKIAQYNLSFPIPNALLEPFCQIIAAK
jgi:hypothetical protein